MYTKSHWCGFQLLMRYLGYLESLPPTRLEPFSVKNQFSWPNCCILISLKSNVLWQIWKVYRRDGQQLEAPNNLSMFYFSNRKRFSGLLKNDKVGRFPLMAITNVVRQSVTAIAIVNHNTSRFSIFSIWNLGYLVIHLSLLATMSVEVRTCTMCQHNVTQCPRNT